MSTESLTHKNKIVRILSLDGGGLRGIISAIILKNMTDLLKEHLDNLDRDSNESYDDVCLYRSFDIVAGTSTGALLTAALTRPAEDKPLDTGSSSSELIEIYKKHGSRVFPPSVFMNNWSGVKYDSKGFDDVLKQYLGDYTLSQALTRVIIMSYDMISQKPVIFDSQKSASFIKPDYSMRVVCHASAAAPTYFGALDGVSDAERDSILLVDGGIVANNPSLIALMEAQKSYPPGTIYHVLSIGTGFNLQPQKLEGLRNAGVIQWATKITPVMMQANSDIAEILMQNNPSVRFKRIQVDLPREYMAMDKQENLHDLERLARSFCERKRDELLQIVTTFLDPISTSPKALCQKGKLLMQIPNPNLSECMQLLWQSYYYGNNDVLPTIAKLCEKKIYPPLEPKIICHDYTPSFDSYPYPIVYKSPSFWYHRAFEAGILEVETDLIRLYEEAVSDPVSQNVDIFAAYFYPNTKVPKYWGKTYNSGQGLPGVFQEQAIASRNEVIHLQSRYIQAYSGIDEAKITENSRYTASICYSSMGLLYWYASLEGAKCYFEKSAEIGSPIGIQCLAAMQYVGYSPDKVKIDKEQALKGFLKASDKGYAYSAYVAGRVYEEQKDNDSAMRMYSKAAKHNFGMAEFAIAQLKIVRYLSNRDLGIYNDARRYVERSARHEYINGRNLVRMPIWFEGKKVDDSNSESTALRHNKIATLIMDEKPEKLSNLLTRPIKGASLRPASPRSYSRLLHQQGRQLRG